MDLVSRAQGRGSAWPSLHHPRTSLRSELHNRSLGIQRALADCNELIDTADEALEPQDEEMDVADSFSSAPT